MVSCRVRDGVLGLESTGCVVELSQDALKACVEPSLLGGSELFGNDELGEIQECLTDAFEALLELGGEGGGGGARLRLGAHPAERCS